MMFYYAGRASDGRRIEGSIEATSRDAAAAHLRARNVFATTVEREGTVGSAWTFLRLSFGAGSARVAFFRSFAALVNAGVPVRRSLETLIRQCRAGGFTEALNSIAADVEAGAALSTALARHPLEFSPIAIAIVKSGELSGALDAALHVRAELEENDRALRKRVTAALTYPCIVGGVAAILVALLLANTVPAFAATFAELHVPLPLGTRLLIAAAAILRKPALWGVLAGAAFAAFGAMRRYKTSDAPWAAVIDRVRLSTPAIGNVVAKSTVARFARALASLLRAGVDIVAALEAAAGVVEGPTYRHGVRGIVAALRRGEALVGPFEASGLFDATFLQLLQAGEESGSVDDMLFRVARYYDLDVESALTALTSALEPLLICTLGIVIGSIVASIIIPLYSMIGNIQ
jgi:type IV pilus assembly protein PilC